MDEENENDAEIAAAWEAELMRRLAEIREGKAVGKPADELFAELEREDV